jgi:hypothetical protein
VIIIVSFFKNDINNNAQSVNLHCWGTAEVAKPIYSLLGFFSPQNEPSIVETG